MSLFSIDKSPTDNAMTVLSPIFSFIVKLSIAANKNKGIRAALCCTNFHAKMSRKHNDANIITFGARFTDIKSMYRMTDIFINTDFEGGRHLIRVNKIE